MSPTALPPDVPEEQKLRTFKQVGVVLGVHPNTVARWAEDGTLWLEIEGQQVPVMEEDHKGPYAVRARLDLWIQQHRKAVGAPKHASSAANATRDPEPVRLTG